MLRNSGQFNFLCGFLLRCSFSSQGSLGRFLLGNSGGFSLHGLSIISHCSLGLLLIGLSRDLLGRIALVNSLLGGGVGYGHAGECGVGAASFNLVVDVLAGAFVVRVGVALVLP